jgi:hypothetical protein
MHEYKRGQEPKEHISSFGTSSCSGYYFLLPGQLDLGALVEAACVPPRFSPAKINSYTSALTGSGRDENVFINLRENAKESEVSTITLSKDD